MELHERLSETGNGATPSRGVRDPFAEIKNRIHLRLVSELGPELARAEPLFRSHRHWMPAPPRT